jgi:hypothetical protein
MNQTLKYYLEELKASNDQGKFYHGKQPTAAGIQYFSNVLENNRDGLTTSFSFIT